MFARSLNVQQFYTKLIHAINQGFPHQRSLPETNINDFWEVRNRLSTDRGLVLMDGKMVIPKSHRTKILHRLQLHMEKKKQKRIPRTPTYDRINWWQSFWLTLAAEKNLWNFRTWNLTLFPRSRDYAILSNGQLTLLSLSFANDQIPADEGDRQKPLLPRAANRLFLDYFLDYIKPPTPLAWTS